MAPEIAAPLALLAAALFAFAGFAALARAMTGPPGAAPPPNPARKLVARLTGAALLFAAYAVCVMGWGVSVGIVGWLGVLTLAGLAFVFLSGLAPRLAGAAAVAAPPAAALAVLAGIMAG